MTTAGTERRGGGSDRLRTAILEAAADLVAERGSDVSMGEIAAAAGCGRATLYRLYPTRESLVEALFATVIRQADERLAAAGLDEVPFEEAVARAARALVAVGSRYLVLMQEHGHVPKHGAHDDCGEELVRARIRALVQRGLDEGAVRPELPVAWLEHAFGGTILAGVKHAAMEGVSVETAAALVTRQFLDGVRARD